MDFEKIKAVREKQAVDKQRQLDLKREGIQTGVIAAAVSEAAKKQIEARKTTTIPVTVTDDLATPEDIEKVVAELKRLSVVLKPEAIELQPLITQLEKVATKLDELPSRLPKVPEQKTNMTVTNFSELQKDLKAVSDAIKKIPAPIVEPKINVPAPVVNIPEVDFTPVTDAIKEAATQEEKVEYKDFIAQDIDSQDVMQYVGLIHPDGYWGLIENDLENDSMRFVFGKGDYSKAWEDRVGKSYKLLDEALNEINA